MLLSRPHGMQIAHSGHRWPFNHTEPDVQALTGCVKTPSTACQAVAFMVQPAICTRSEEYRCKVRFLLRSLMLS